MKQADNLLKLAILIVTIIGVIKLISIDDKASNFYEYKSTKINLKQIKQITPRLDYIISYKEDEEKDIFHKYSTSLNKKEINNLETFLIQASSSEYYNVEIVAYMMLDSFKVELFHSKKYMKKPHTYVVSKELLSTLSKNGLDKFQYENLKEIEGKSYDNLESFFDDVIAYAKLRRSEWSKRVIPELGMGTKANKFLSYVDPKTEEKVLEPQDIKNIMQNLKEAFDVYDGLQ